MTNMIGLIGTNGAGKSTAGAYFESLGYTFISLSDFVRSEVLSSHLPLDRDTLRNTANRMKKTFGLAFLAEMALKKAGESKQEKIVFDSIRHIRELELLKKNGAYLIGIDAPVSLRFERIQSRGQGVDDVDFETFVKQDDAENKGESAGQNIQQCLQVCDHVVSNIGNEVALIKTLDKVLGVAKR